MTTLTVLLLLNVRSDVKSIVLLNVKFIPEKDCDTLRFGLEQDAEILKVPEA